ncbi:MAG: hypothetical protein [Bacteriophage sp.]|nr:MAG: hypothetical protein [Bacteriophage sp.]
MSYIKFAIQYQPINTNIQIDSGVDCNSINFINLGTAPVSIDQSVPLQQGQQYPIDGNVGEIMQQQMFLITFTGAGTKSVMVIKKVYV